MDPVEQGGAEKASSSKVILSIIVILVVAAIAFAMLRNDDGAMDGATTTPATTTDATGGTTFSGDVFSLVARGGDWKCTWSSEREGVSLDGTVFVSRGKFKSDVEMSGVGINATAHVIGDGTYVYSWSSLMPSGVRFPASQGTIAVEAGGTNAQYAQLSGDYTYDCDPWTAESGTFALPSGVTFQDAATVN